MNTTGIKKMTAMVLSFLIVMALAATGFAQEAKPGGAVAQENGSIETEVWAGVTVDYMFPLRYEVYDPQNQPLADVSIEHYDHTQGEYVYVGRTNAQGVWETQVPAGYFSDVIIGGAQGVSVADTRALYEGSGELKHRLSKDGFVIVEGPADYTVETDEQGQTTIVIRITMQYDEPQSDTTKPESGESTPGSSDTTKPESGAAKPESGSSKPNGGSLPQTGVPAYWMFLGLGSLLLLLAALILLNVYKKVKNTQKNDKARGNLI